MKINCLVINKHKETVYLLIIPKILVLFLLQSANAQTFKVTMDSTSYEIKITHRYIAFKDQFFSQKIIKKNCNKLLIEQFRKNWVRHTSSLVIIKNGRLLNGVINVLVDSQKKYTIRYSKSGLYLSQVPSVIKNLWFTSKRLCS